jgi:hypothetical protein
MREGRVSEHASRTRAHGSWIQRPRIFSVALLAVVIGLSAGAIVSAKRDPSFWL